jgi:hypothetical protein
MASLPFETWTIRPDIPTKAPVTRSVSISLPAAPSASLSPITIRDSVPEIIDSLKNDDWRVRKAGAAKLNKLANQRK